MWKNQTLQLKSEPLYSVILRAVFARRHTHKFLETGVKVTPVAEGKVIADRLNIFRGSGQEQPGPIDFLLQDEIINACAHLLLEFVGKVIF